MVTSLLPFGEEFEEDLARLGVEVGGRLVHDQHLGVAAQRDGDQELLLHAARELDEGPRQDRVEIEAEAPGQCVDFGRIGAAQRGGKIDQLRHGHFQRRRQLRHEAYRAQHRRALLARVAAVDGDGAVVGVFAQQAADQGGLAGAVGADQRDALGQPDLQADVVEHAGLAEALGYIFKSDHGG
jgi:hypothetical protein